MNLRRGSEGSRVYWL